MASRRGHGEGSIYQRSRDGRWCGVVDLGRAPDGRRIRRSVTGATRQEVATKLRALQQAADDNRLRIEASMTLERWLSSWLADHVAHRATVGELRPSTVSSYRQHVRDHIGPHIGAVRLDRLRPAHVRQLHATLLDKGLSPATVARIHATLRKALADAESDELIMTNAASKVSAPSGTTRQPSPLPVEQARALLSRPVDDPWQIAYVLMLGCGLRAGETLALRWSDIDLDSGSLTVRRQVRRHDGELLFGPPKSARSRRTIVMPQLVMNTLEEHRRLQLKTRMRAVVWEDEDLVVSTGRGTVVDHRNLYRHWEGLRAEMHIDPSTRLHDLRHSAASIALLAGVPLRAVAEFLGHSQISVTADTYSHVLDEMKQQTAERLDTLLRGTDDRPR